MKLPSAPPGTIPASDSLRACLAAILECEPERVPAVDAAGAPIGVGVLSRWLGGLGLGLAPVADPARFSWPGPWIARVQPPQSDAGSDHQRYAVMFGVPSGVVWDPAGDGQVRDEWIAEGYLVAAGDVALSRPHPPAPPETVGRVEHVCVAASAGEPAQRLDAAEALPGRGLAGDRHVTGDGTFPSGLPGSALTLIAAEVCESFAPELGPDEHRRNIVTRGIALNDLVGHEFTIGAVRCRGMRLCEPCTVVQRYAGRPVLRELVHRGGLRADILTTGRICVGDEVRALADSGDRAGAAGPG